MSNATHTVKFFGVQKSIEAWKVLLSTRFNLEGRQSTHTQRGYTRHTLEVDMTDEQRESLDDVWYETGDGQDLPWNHCLAFTEIEYAQPIRLKK